MAGPETQQDPIRLKNLLGEAETKLLAVGMDKRGVQLLLQPGFDLLEDGDFWRHQSQGLALFLTAESMEMYRLPLAFESLVVVGDRFHLKPLLPLFSSDRYFYLLALSQNQVRLFQSTRYHISEVDLDRVPTSLAEALRYDDPQAQLQFHNVSGSGSVPNYHGHGVGTDDNNENIQRFLRTVNEGLQPHLNQEDAPLVIASVDYLQPIYREVNTYPHLLEEGVSGNPDEAQPDDLREAAWEKVSTLLEESHQQAVVHYNNLKSTNQASDRLPDLLTAACRGQVDVMFTKANAHCWGQFDFNSGQLQQHDQPQPHDQDLLDLAAVQTFLQGGTVYLLDEAAMPTQTPVAAVYRYTVAA